MKVSIARALKSAEHLIMLSQIRQERKVSIARALKSAEHLLHN